MSRLDDIIDGDYEGLATTYKQQIKELFDNLVVEIFTDTGGDVAEIRKRIEDL